MLKFKSIQDLDFLFIFGYFDLKQKWLEMELVFFFRAYLLNDKKR